MDSCNNCAYFENDDVNEYGECRNNGQVWHSDNICGYWIPKESEVDG